VETPLPHLIGGSPQEFEWILRQLDRTAVVCLDTSHTTLGGQWHRFVDVAGDRIAHIHANDHRGQFDDHLAPGDGRVDWAAVSASLKTLGFAGWVMLELKCAPNTSHADHFARGYAQAAKLLA
jgi:sugar phosphate isomerase/epimerase